MSHAHVECVDQPKEASRFLLLYVNKVPNRPLDPLVEQFLRFVLSREGQEVVVKDGYLELPTGPGLAATATAGSEGLYEIPNERLVG